MSAASEIRDWSMQMAKLELREAEASDKPTTSETVSRMRRKIEVAEAYLTMIEVAQSFVDKEK